MDIIGILTLLGGIGLFLYGLSLMTSSLEKVAGSGLERVLERHTTSNKKGLGHVRGWCFGAGVTAIIQNSAAVTVMLSGFVNAGIMKLGQALPVVFGSNVGSTITAQILRLGDIGSDTLLLRLIQPSTIAPMLVGIGAFMVIFSKKKRVKDIAGILVGLGMLFYGMTLMEQVFEPLKGSEGFRQFFTTLSNPVIGLIAGPCYSCARSEFKRFCWYPAVSFDNRCNHVRNLNSDYNRYQFRKVYAYISWYAGIK